MFYTVGDPHIYDEILFINPNGLRKLGREKDYIGGIVFLNFDEANNAKKNYSVYILETTMDNLYFINGNYHLKDTCKIIKKV